MAYVYLAGGRCLTADLDIGRLARGQGILRQGAVERSGSRLLNYSFAPTFLLSNSGSPRQGEQTVMEVTTLWSHKTAPYDLGALSPPP